MIKKYADIGHLGDYIEDERGNDIVQDLSRVWTDCIVRVLNDLWVVAGVYEYNNKPVMKLICINNSKRKKRICSLDHNTKASQLEKDYPTLGYYNLPNTAVYLTRKTMRQWKVGIHHQTVSMNVPFDRMIEQRANNYTAGVFQFSTNIQSMCKDIDVFQPEYPRYGESIDNLRAARIPSVALSRDVVIALHPINGEVHVMYHEMSVGAVRDNGELILKEGYGWLLDTLMEVIHDNNI